MIGDKDRLVQATLNLLSNAVKFCPEKNGLIDIQLVPKNGNIELSIWDNGQGISKEFLPYLFDRFTQDATLSKPAGSGLGLYITKEIIERHQGKISVKSKQGKGTKFLVKLKRRAMDEKGAVLNRSCDHK